MNHQTFPHIPTSEDNAIIHRQSGVVSRIKPRTSQVQQTTGRAAFVWNYSVACGLISQRVTMLRGQFAVLKDQKKTLLL